MTPFDALKVFEKRDDLEFVSLEVPGISSSMAKGMKELGFQRDGDIFTMTRQEYNQRKPVSEVPRDVVGFSMNARKKLLKPKVLEEPKDVG